MHAHRCENCFKHGKTTVWFHDDTHAGPADDVNAAAAHTCPVCGAKEWKKWLMQVAQVPKAAAQTPAYEAYNLTVVPLLDVAYVLAYTCLLVYGVWNLVLLYQRYFGSKGKGPGRGVAHI